MFWNSKKLKAEISDLKVRLFMLETSANVLSTAVAVAQDDGDINIPIVDSKGAIVYVDTEAQYWGMSANEAFHMLSEACGVQLVRVEGTIKTRRIEKELPPH